MNAVQHLLRGCVRLYQLTGAPLLTTLFGPMCRFEPSCSAYAMEAIRVHGACKGAWLATKRIGRCHPWGGSGNDPVPPRDHDACCQVKTEPGNSICTGSAEAG